MCEHRTCGVARRVVARRCHKIGLPAVRRGNGYDDGVCVVLLQYYARFMRRLSPEKV